jgi:predicted aconitase
MGVVTTCSCTPYLFGNLPHFGEHVAWAESSAVCYANAVLGARTNREGGPSALAAALTGRTPRYGCHLDENRRPDLTVRVEAALSGTPTSARWASPSAGQSEARQVKAIPYVRGVSGASLEELKSFCASLATYGGLACSTWRASRPKAACTPRPPKR